MTSEQRRRIEASAERLTRRWLAVESLRGFLRAWFWALIAAAGVIFIVPDARSTLALATLTLALATGIALALGLCSAMARRPNGIALAKAWDDRSGAKDRLSSALELGGSGPMIDLMRDEALAAASRVDPSVLLPHRLPREGRWLPVPALLCAVAMFLPAWLEAEADVGPSFQEAARDHLRDLDEFVAKEKAKDPTGKRKDLIAKLERLSVELNRQKMDKKDLLAEVGKMAEELQKEQDKQLEQKRELEKSLKSPKAGDFNKDLEDSLKNGDYQDAASKIDQLLDELEKKLKELKEKKATPEELAAIEEQIRKLKELKARMMKLLNMNFDINAMSEILDFLDAFEGDLGDIEWIDARFVKKCDCDGKCKSDCKKAALCLNPKGRPSLRAGRGTTEDFLGKEGTRIDATREEHKQTVREGSGKSSFTQTKVANDGSKSRLEEKDVFLAEKRAAEDAIQRQEIPAGYREYVRRYFEGIQPDEPAAEKKSGENK